jgi:hypothetical protein
MGTASSADVGFHTGPRLAARGRRRIVAPVDSGDVLPAAGGDDGPAGGAAAWSAQAFGLTVAGPLAVGSLVPSGTAERPDTWLERVPRAAIETTWQRAHPRTVLERRLADGRVGLRVQQDAHAGFRVWAPRHGSYLVSPDGRQVAAAPPPGPAWRWERLVVAQVLPLAAVLRGMEVLHASAVALGTVAVAFLGASGAGKTTIAGRLVSRGAALVTDDVLALDTASTGVRAHRGAAIARMDPRELRAIPPDERAALGPVEARDEKWHLRPAPGPARLPLGITYQLVREARTGGVAIDRVRPYEPDVLLGHAFLPYMTAPERLRRQLDVLAAVAAGVPLFRVRIGADAPPGAVADAVLPHARTVLAAGER